MKGKAQLILTDRDTGRVVDRIEEHNMVTNVLNNIFDIPRMVYTRYASYLIFDGYLPIYKYLMGGLVMLGSNIKEDPDNYMIPADAGFIGTAGSVYSGTVPTRGTLNQSQSGEIDGGYRFVWDFAPEKAIGTIRCIGLTNQWFGNIHFTLNAQDGRLLVNPLVLSSGDSYSTKISHFTVKGAFLGFLDNDSTVYSLKLNGSSFTIYRSRFPDVGRLTITNTASQFINTDIIRQDSYSIPFSITNDTFWAFNAQSKTLFFFYTLYTSSNKTLSVKYCEADPRTGDKLRQGEFTITTEPYSSHFYSAYGNELYFFANNTLYVISMEGVLLKSILIPGFSGASLYWLNGQQMICGSYSNNFYTAYIDKEPFVYMRTLFGYQSSDYLKQPYVLYYTKSSSSTTDVYIMMRTDYLATINNLSVPLEKTDKHALQVRYEITED